MSSVVQVVPKDGFNLWFDTNSILELGPDLYYLYPVAMLDLLHNLKIWLFQELSYQSASESTVQPEGTGVASTERVLQQSPTKGLVNFLHSQLGNQQKVGSVGLAPSYRP